MLIITLLQLQLDLFLLLRRELRILAVKLQIIRVLTCKGRITVVIPLCSHIRTTFLPAEVRHQLEDLLGQILLKQRRQKYPGM